MRGRHHQGNHAATAFAAAALWMSAFLVGAARGDDLVTLSGKTYRDARPVRVEPDGVTWRYAEGICKVDFTDSPPAVREAYHYDAARAAAYHDARAQEQRQAGEQARQLVQAQDEREHARARTEAQTPATADQGALPSATPTLTYRHGLAPAVEAAARALDEQAEAQKAQAAADVRNSEGLLGNPRIWSLFPGVGSKPVPQRVDRPNSLQFKASLLSIGDDFFDPIYMTKSYNVDLDRAAAFARGTPLK